MSELRKAAQQALKTLESMSHEDSIFAGEFDGEIAALRAALAKPEQEPVCDKDPGGCWNVRCQLGKVCKNTAPTPRKPLTDQEIDALDNLPSYPSDAEVIAFARRIEQAHGIK